MEVKAYIATLNNEYGLEIYPCVEVPDFVHAVKYDKEQGLELYFSDNTAWTSELEELAWEQMLEDIFLFA